MANNYTSAEKQAKILADLSKYGPSNYSRLKDFLRLISTQKNFEVELDKEMVSFTPQEMWDIVSPICGELNFSFGDRGNIFPRTAKILEDIDKREKGETASNSAKYELIRKQLEDPIVKPGAPPTDPSGEILRKSTELQRKQIELLEAKFLGKLRKNLTDAPIFKNSDPHTRALILQMVAAGNHNFRTVTNFTPDDLNRLLLSVAGQEQINKETHRLYSKDSKSDFVKMVGVINETINDVYSEDEDKYERDMATLRDASSLTPRLSDVDDLVGRTMVYGTPAEKAKLVSAIRTEIIHRSRSGYVSGDDIITSALARSGTSRANLSYLVPLSPYFESMRVDETNKLLGPDLKTPRKRSLLAIFSLAETFGVDLEAAWANPQSLASAQKAITDKYGVNTLVEAYGKTNDLHELSEIRNLMSLMSDNTRYRTGLRDHPFLSLQDAWAKTWNRPVSEKFSIFDPFRAVNARWTNFQTNIAINIHDWAINVNSTSWFSGIAGHIGDFTEGFIKHNADWTAAREFFVERKWGNLLDWAAKKAGHESWSTAKTSFLKGVIKTIEIGGNKFAAGLGSKIALSLTELVTSEAGVGLLLMGGQVLWESGKFFLEKVSGFFKSIWNGDSKNLYGAISIWLGGLFLMANTFLAGIPALVAGALAMLKSFLKLVWDNLLALLALAAAVTFGIIMFFVVIWSIIISPTVHLDSGPGQLVANIVCSLAGAEAPGNSSNPRLAAGKCVFELLSKAGINPLNKGNAAGAAFSSFETGLGNGTASDMARYSATQYGAFQCSGFDSVVDIMTGGVGDFTDAHNLDTINPSGYTFVAGVESCSPGDFFVDKNGTWGHTGLFVELAGAIIKCLDANFDGMGTVRDEKTCQWPTNRIAGCLKGN